MNNFPKKPGIYLLTCTINGKPYIGETCDLNRRMSEYKRGYGTQLINDAIRKHGWENFSKEIIESFDYDDKIERISMEAAYIQFYNSLTENQGGSGYNILLCGTDRTGFKHTEETKEILRQMSSGKKASEETKKKMSKARKGKYTGKNSWNYGKKLSEEQRLKIAKRIKENPPFLGCKHTEKAKAKMSEVHSGKILSEEHKKNIGKSIAGEKNGFYNKEHTKECKDKISVQNSKEYKFTSPDGQIVTIFGLNKFCKENNLNQGGMWCVAKGTKNSHKGWTKA